VPQPVFVSYSEPDRKCALELVAFAESAGFGCWIAPRDISPSSEWAAEIIDAISAAQVMVLIFSSNSNGSPQVRREVERAVHKQLTILPFRIENVLPSKSLEYFLSAQQWLDAFPPPLEPHYENLCRHLRHALGGRPAAGPAGAPSIAPPTQTQGPIDAEALRQVELGLAVYLGPVAKVLVKRAAGRCAHWDDMVRELATELDGESHRREFLEACRTIRRPRPISGT